jgi:hypothetical protein
MEINDAVISYHELSTKAMNDDPKIIHSPQLWGGIQYYGATQTNST